MPLDKPISPAPARKPKGNPANKDFSDALTMALNPKGETEESAKPEKHGKSQSERKKAPEDPKEAWSLYASAPLAPPAPNPILKGGAVSGGTASSQTAAIVPKVTEGETREGTLIEGAKADAKSTSKETLENSTTKPEANPKTDPELAAPPKTSDLEQSLKLLSGSRKETEGDGAEQKMPDGQKVDPVKGEENAVLPAKPAQNPDGTAAAQGVVMPRSAFKLDEIAAPPKEKAAVHAGQTASTPAAAQAEAADPAKKTAPPVAAPATEKAKEIKVDFSSPEIFNVGQKAHSEPLAQLDETAAPRPTVAEAAISTIHQNVQLLRSSNNTQVDLVFRPDQNTQIFLQVIKVNGEIQVQARCERGDLGHLSATWGQLQETLAHQGIRVEPLQSGARGEGFFGSNYSGQHSNQQQSDSEARSTMLDHLLPIKPLKTSSPGRATPARGAGWQGWA
jgi:hypothetical protein